MLKNLVKYMFVVLIALVAGINQAAAQSETIEISEAEKAIAAGSAMNDECSRVFVGSDGHLTVEQHGGFYSTVAAVADLHNFSNNDGVTDTGAKSCFGGYAGVGYRLVRKDWWLAGFGEVGVGYNGSYHVENRVVDGHMNFSALAGVENSHGKINVGPFIKYGYDNMVSENAAQQPWRGNKHKLELGIRVSTTLFHFGSVKNYQVGNKMIPVKTKRAVKLFAEGSYNLTNSIEKCWDEEDAALKGFHPELNDKNFTIRVGLQIFLR